MELTDVENLIVAGGSVVAILGAGGEALRRVCRRFDRVEQQNAVQSAQLATLTRAVEQIQQWAMGGKDGR
mgnify:CR=1 FL=1